MKLLRFVYFILLTCILCAQEGSIGFFSVRQDKTHYPVPETQLANLVKRKGKRRENHLVVVGYLYPDHDFEAWIYWKEDDALILWEGVKDPSLLGPDPYPMSRRYLHLKKDIVPTVKDLHGSTYLETRAWANRVIADCKAHGELFVIK